MYLLQTLKEINPETNTSPVDCSRSDYSCWLIPTRHNGSRVYIQYGTIQANIDQSFRNTIKLSALKPTRTSLAMMLKHVNQSDKMLDSDLILSTWSSHEGIAYLPLILSIPSSSVGIRLSCEDEWPTSTDGSPTKHRCLWRHDFTNNYL